MSKNPATAYGVASPKIALAPIPIPSKRAPTANDLNYPLGQLWAYEGSGLYGLIENKGGSATWNLLSAASSGILTLTGDSGGAISPSSNNINLLGTTNQIVTTGSGSTITWSLPSAMIVPGSLEVSTTLTVDGASTLTGNVLIAGTLGVTGLTTLGALTQVGTANINHTGTAITNIGGSSGAVTITAGSGNLAVVGGGNTIGIGNDAAANTVVVGSTTASASLSLQSGSGGNTSIAGNAAATITIGASAQTGKISIADSTAAMPAVDLMNGVAAGAQVLNIASGTSATAAQTVNILNGATPGANTSLNIMNGAGSAGTQAIAILSSGATRAGTYNIGDGNAAHVGVIGSTAASASLTLHGGSGTTGLSLSAAGNVQMVPATSSTAGTSVTMNNRVCVATFTGLTTASSASQALTITNSTILATSGILASVYNLDASGNHAALAISKTVVAAGSVVVTYINNGAGALGTGDNVVLTLWVIS